MRTLHSPEVFKLTLLIYTNKFYIIIFSCRQELKPFGVSVHIIEPGYFKTAMTDSARITDVIRHTWQSLPQSTQNEYGTTYVDKC